MPLCCATGSLSCAASDAQGGHLNETHDSRRQQHHQPRLLRHPDAQCARRHADQRGLRLSEHVPARFRPGAAAGGVCRVRRARPHVPPRAVCALQGAAQAHAGGARRADAAAQADARLHGRAAAGAGGWEADDPARHGRAPLRGRGWTCDVVTGDKDSLQLITDSTRVFNVKTRMGQTDTIEYTPERFREEYGFDPIRA